MSKEKREETVKRVQMDLPLKSFQELNSLKEYYDAASYAEVIRRFLKLFIFVIARKKEGSQFLIKDKDGVLTEVFF